jgi:hypothetical protein
MFILDSSVEMEGVKCIVQPSIFFDRGIPQWFPERCVLIPIVCVQHQPRRLMSFEEFHSRYPHHRIIFELLKKIEKIWGFLLGVVVALFMFQYLMGYVNTG